MHRLAEGYEFVCRVVLTLFIAHIAFLVHTLMGAVVVGFFPSIAGLYSTFRTWALDVSDRHWTVKRTWNTFHEVWKLNLKSANLVGYPVFALWLFLVWEYWIVQNNSVGIVGIGVSGGLLLVNFLYGIFLSLVGVIQANFEQSAWWVIKYAAMMAVVRVKNSFIILLVYAATWWFVWQWPGLIPAFGFSIPVFLIVLSTYCYGRIPGMDVHVNEPDIDAKKAQKKDQKKAVRKEQ